ncbi:hypothetical protein ESCO_004912 [Escovopsis weberi]|uniref:Uncharacterized protein n=1 Tax=Escovopsis weberi TaxID=150374 RepID=A0A0M8MZM0_ESCWE|nr:hypothetical protein ESCO_004912 [Escovopsis weberi]
MLVAYAQKRSLLVAAAALVLLLTYVWVFFLLPGLGSDGAISSKIPTILHGGSGSGGGDGENGDAEGCPQGMQRYGNSTTCEPVMMVNGKELRLPADVKKIMALVFFGRRTTVSILDCYLKRNLKKNGGVLDGVIFLERTSKEDDVAFLEKLLASEPAYERWKIDMDGEGYASSYDRIQDDTMYIKIDDDIVYIEDNAFASIISTKAAHPEYFVVSGNVVNQPLISWLHWNLGAIKPYLPELNKAYPAPKAGSKLSWRPSLLPAWQGKDDFEVKDWNPPDHQRHRWLPIKGKTDHILDKSPIIETEYDAFGPGLKKWQVAAQEHMSLFENIEMDELDRYRFRTWDFQLRRMGIQFICILGKDINLAKPIAGDDEHHLAVTMPAKTGRHAVADGGAIVAHYSFGPQSGNEKIEQTDILERYRALARDSACASPMLWSPEDKTS